MDQEYINELIELWQMKHLSDEGFKSLVGVLPLDYIRDNMCNTCRSFDCICDDAYDRMKDEGL